MISIIWALCALLLATAMAATAVITPAPVPTCISNATTDLDCITDFYQHQTCATDDINCQVSAYKEEYLTSANATWSNANLTATIWAHATHSVDSMDHQTTVAAAATSLPDVVKTVTLPTYQSTVSTVVVPGDATEPASPTQTECVPGDQFCYWKNDKPAGPPPDSPFIDPYDDDDVAGSPIDELGKINGKCTPLVKLKHEEDNDDNSRRCYRAMMHQKGNTDEGHHGFHERNCVLVLHPEVVKKDPYKGVAWHNAEAADYARSKGRSPPCIDLRVDTGCDFKAIGWQERCIKDFEFTYLDMQPYREVNCSSFSASMSGGSTGGDGDGDGDRFDQLPEDIHA